MSGATNRGFSFPEQQQDKGRTGERRPEFGTRPAETGTSGVVGTVKDKAQNLAASASHLASDVKDKAQEWTSNVADKAEATWESTKQCTQDMAGRVADTAEDAYENVTMFIRRYPLPSLLVSFGLGFLMAQCFQGMMSTGRGRGSWQI
jgi:ElaB/YqjD/DUF883 family membrane-anchored ribosome-binding protein